MGDTCRLNQPTTHIILSMLSTALNIVIKNSSFSTRDCVTYLKQEIMNRSVVLLVPATYGINDSEQFFHFSLLQLPLSVKWENMYLLRRSHVLILHITYAKTSVHSGYLKNKSPISSIFYDEETKLYFDENNLILIAEKLLESSTSTPIIKTKIECDLPPLDCFLLKLTYILKLTQNHCLLALTLNLKWWHFKESWKCKGCYVAFTLRFIHSDFNMTCYILASLFWKGQIHQG